MKSGKVHSARILQVAKKEGTGIDMYLLFFTVSSHLLLFGAALRERSGRPPRSSGRHRVTFQRSRVVEGHPHLVQARVDESKGGGVLHKRVTWKGEVDTIMMGRMKLKMAMIQGRER